MNYNNKDIFLQRATANQTFEEYALRMQPNGVVVSDAAGNLAVVPSTEASPTSSWALMAITASQAINSDSASWAPYQISASYAPTTTIGLTTTQSWWDAITAMTQSMYIQNGLIVSWSIAP